MNSNVPQSAPICRQCGYNLNGLQAVVLCPECGQSDPMIDASALIYRPWLHRFALLFVTMTFGLLMLGGTVTSKGVGLAVPDWPTTFSQNMFLFPPSQWVGGIFWEHTHRLMGAMVGMMTIGIAIWLWRTQRVQSNGQRWLGRFGMATLVMVIIQGIMGGLRVTELSIAWAIAHGITAQLFFCMTILIAAATSRWWITQRSNSANSIETIDKTKGAAPLRLAYVVLGIAVVQLALGAAMRHSGAGLAIPDFPTMYGSVLPPFNQADIETAMIAHTADDYSAAPNNFYTSGHVAIHFAHRVWAVVVLLAVCVLAFVLTKRMRPHRLVKRSLLIVLALLGVQIALGAWVIWSTRHPEVATAHQVTGAAFLGNLFLLTVRLRRLPLSSTPRSASEVADRSPQAQFGLEAAQV